jgi:hypothetical protein
LINIYTNNWATYREKTGRRMEFTDGELILVMDSDSGNILVMYRGYDRVTFKKKTGRRMEFTDGELILVMDSDSGHILVMYRDY